MSNLNLPICPNCNGSMRYVRRDQMFRCQYCDYECDRVVARGLYPKTPEMTKEAPQDTPIMQVFNAITRPTAAATSSTPANHYDLRSEK